ASTRLLRPSWPMVKCSSTSQMGAWRLSAKWILSMFGILRVCASVGEDAVPQPLHRVLLLLPGIAAGTARRAARRACRLHRARRPHAAVVVGVEGQQGRVVRLYLQAAP